MFESDLSENKSLDHWVVAEELLGRGREHPTDLQGPIGP